ncbi:MAG: helix-turn-helix domain-containing protein [Thermoprotei archaeon]
MNKKKEQTVRCPLQEMVSIVTKKWFLLVLNQIGNQGTIRYNELFKELSGISPKSLADTLKDLQRANLVKREILEGAPPKVEYRLTEDGEALRESVVPLLKWAARYTNHISCPILGNMVERK